MHRVTMMKLTTWMIALWLVGMSGASLVAQAGAPGATPAAAGQAVGQEPQDQFVPVKSLPQQDQLPASTLLITAYGFIWAVLLVYLWTIWRRLVKVEREMQELSAKIGEKSARR